MKLRLTRRQLGSLIKESVRQIINELDITSAPMFHDARDRAKWWQEQLLKEFPFPWARDRIMGAQSDFYGLYEELCKEKEWRDKRSAYRNVAKDVLLSDQTEGVEKIPLIMRNHEKKWGHITKVKKVATTDKAFLTFVWRMKVRGKKTDLVIKCSVYLHPNKNKVYLNIEDSNAKRLDDRMTNVFASKHLNSLINKRYREITKKESE